LISYANVKKWQHGFFWVREKTVVTLTTISDLLDARIIKRPLIIGPIRVIQNVWRQEAAQWSHLKKLNFFYGYGYGKRTTGRVKRKKPIFT